MNVTDKNQIEQVVKFLKSAAEQEQDWQLSSAIVNVYSALEQALESHIEDKHHPHLLLEIVKAETIMDHAIKESCTTDCIRLSQGTCPYLTISQKYKCPRIYQCLENSSSID